MATLLIGMPVVSSGISTNQKDLPYTEILSSRFDNVTSFNATTLSREVMPSPEFNQNVNTFNIQDSSGTYIADADEYFSSVSRTEFELSPRNLFSQTNFDIPEPVQSRSNGNRQYEIHPSKFTIVMSRYFDINHEFTIEDFPEIDIRSIEVDTI